MFQINCLNPISQISLKNFSSDYAIVDDVNKAEGI